MRSLQFCFALLLCSFVSPPLQAAITGIYTDASELNTTPPAALLGGSDNFDNLWEIRPNFGEFSTIFEGYETASETLPTITTSVFGLDPTKTYDIRAIYWTHATDGWGVSAGVTGSALLALNNTNGTLTGATAAGGLLEQREFKIGFVQGVSSFSVDIDGSNVARNWYDGVSHLEVAGPPPPGAITGTYIDASPLNTTPATALLGNSSETDGLWEVRPGFGEGDTIFEAYDGPSDPTPHEDVPLITTTYTGLDPTKIYDVRAIYWTHQTAGWGISAGLTGEPLQALNNSNGILTGNFDAGTLLEQREFVLGQVLGVTSLSVDVDGSTGQARNWYDGVSFLEVGTVPEPGTATLALFASVGLLTALRRRVVK